MKKLKKIFKVLIPIAIIAGIGLFIYFVFKEVTPYDDTKKLHIYCNGNHKSYNILSSDDIVFMEKDEKCMLTINVRNVDRNYVKLKSKGYFYGAKTDGTKDGSVVFNDIIVDPEKKLILYSYDKGVKFEFEYK